MKIKGTKGADYLTGTDGADVIRGGRGRDVIDGGVGDNKLFGGRGADTFLLRSDADGLSTIVGFQPGKDRVILEAPEGWWATYDVTTGAIGSGTTAVPEPGGAFGPAVAVLQGPPPELSQYQDLITV